MFQQNPWPHAHCLLKPLMPYCGQFVLCPTQCFALVMKRYWHCSSIRDCVFKRCVICNSVTSTSEVVPSQSAVARQAKPVVSHFILMQSVCYVAILRPFAVQLGCLSSEVTRSGSCSWLGSISRPKGSRPDLASLSGSHNEPCSN